MTAIDGGSPRTIRQQIEGLLGTQGADRFFEIYRAKYVAEKDIAAIAEWGFDHLRLPMHYNLLYDPDTGTFIESGFELIDTFLDWCRKYEIDVILDMHAAPADKTMALSAIATAWPACGRSLTPIRTSW